APASRAKHTHARIFTKASKAGHDFSTYLRYECRMSKVAILRTSPRTVLRDYHRLLNLAGYQDVLDKAIDTALKINISWHFFFPGSSTTPWQLEGVIRAMKA